MDYLNAAATEVQQVYDTTTLQSSDEVALLRRAISLYAEAFTIDDDLAETKVVLVQKALISHNFNTLYLAFETALRGYYIQSISLLRNIYENWLAILYLEKQPQEVDKWLKLSWKQQVPDQSEMKKAIDHPSTGAMVRLQDIYKDLCKFNHTDPITVLSRFRTIKGKRGIHVGVQYNRNEFEACTFGLCIWAGHTLDTIASTIPPKDKWHEKHRKLSNDLLAYIDKFTENQGGNILT